MRTNLRLLLLLVSLAQLCPANNPLYLHIASIYLPAMQESQNPTLQTPSGQQELSVEALSDPHCRLLAFKILSLARQQPHQQTHCSLDSQVWENLELYSGANLLNVLKRTSLKLGEATFSGILGQPITATKELERRKQVIKTFLEHEQLMGMSHNLLEQLGALEPWLLTFWKEENSFFEENFNRLYLAPSLYGSSAVNTSPTLLELFRRSEDIGTFLLVPFSLLYIRHLFKNGTHQQFMNSVTAVKSSASPSSSFGELWLSLFFNGSELLFSLLNIPIAAYQVTQYHQATYKNLQYLHRRLSYLANVMTVANDLYVVLAHHRTALAPFHECAAIFDLFEKTELTNKRLHQLLELLKTNTFSEPFSYTSHFGRILVAHKLIEQVKDDLVPFLVALGQLDAYVSCARLLQETDHRQACFCFAQYTTKERPYLAMTNFWNPLVNPKKIITNSIELGYPHAGNIILTGQNTGGKSTVLKGIALNILLAQTFGIAAAQSATFTPFDCLSTYMNITDNVKDGQSLFAAEVARAKTLMEVIAAPPKDKKSFVIIDEAFKGTGGEAEGLSYWYAQQIAQHTNCMCINATHYPKLTALERETNGLYQNYKVEVTVDPNGKLVRPYKLERGSTLYNIAEYILVEQGLKPTVSAPQAKDFI